MADDLGENDVFGIVPGQEPPKAHGEGIWFLAMPGCLGMVYAGAVLATDSTPPQGVFLLFATAFVGYEGGARLQDLVTAQVRACLDWLHALGEPVPPPCAFMTAVGSKPGEFQCYSAGEWHAPPPLVLATYTRGLRLVGGRWASWRTLPEPDLSGWKHGGTADV